MFLGEFIDSWRIQWLESFVFWLILPMKRWWMASCRFAEYGICDIHLRLRFSREWNRADMMRLDLYPRSDTSVVMKRRSDPYCVMMVLIRQSTSWYPELNGKRQLKNGYRIDPPISVQPSGQKSQELFSKSMPAFQQNPFIDYNWAKRV